MRAVLSLGCVLLAALSGCDRRERSPAERGASVFARSCAGCHGPTGRGGAVPGFAVAPRDLTDPDLQARLSDTLIRETIQYGKGQMPNFGKALPADDLDNVVAFVRSLARPRETASAAASAASQPASSTSAPSTSSK